MKKVLYIALLMLLSLPLAAKGGERSPLFKVTYGRKAALVHQLKVSPADSLRRMRGISLSVPLAEHVRPRRFEDIYVNPIPREK